VTAPKPEVWVLHFQPLISGTKGENAMKYKRRRLLAERYLAAAK
jgi:hypothetical protein